ncbi:hypothetical protein BWO90_01065 (plasmid) [Sinorhizobium meliloti]|nr:hypothetical protein BWO90_01065 [Sinorhizobium meliloti]
MSGSAPAHRRPPQTSAPPGRQRRGQINRLKTIKRAMYGRAGPELLRERMLPLDQSRYHTK